MLNDGILFVTLSLKTRESSVVAGKVRRKRESQLETSYVNSQMSGQTSAGPSVINPRLNWGEKKKHFSLLLHHFQNKLTMAEMELV